MLLNLVPKMKYHTSFYMTSYGYIIVDSCIISLNLNFIMQLKQFHYIATKVSSRKKCYYFWWSTWLLTAQLWNIWKAKGNTSYMTFWFAENGLAPTTNKYCHFEDRAHLSNFHFSFWRKFYDRSGPFYYHPAIRINFHVISWKNWHFFKFYQSHRNDTLPYLKKACQWHTNCIYWCSFVIGRRSGRKVYKMHHYIINWICHHNMFAIYLSRISLR